MYEKKCNRCHKHSYSSARIGLWLCPYCEHDISQIKATDASHHRTQLQILPSSEILKKLTYTPR